MDATPLEIQNLPRACHEALILAALVDGPRHGYQLAVELERSSGGYFRFNHGTLYPILHRLEKDGLIAGTWSDEGPRRKRKRYAPTAAGERHLASLRDAWATFAERFTALTATPDAAEER